MNLGAVSRELSGRLARLFLPDSTGQRPCHGEDRRYAEDPHFKDLVLFYEHFHGDNGRGSHTHVAKGDARRAAVHICPARDR